MNPRTGGRSRGKRRRGGDRGAVTAELALAIPLLLSLTIGLVWLVLLGAAQVRAVDAAREAARAVARGDDVAAAVEVGRRVAPEGSTVTVTMEGDQVVARSTGTVSGPGGLFAIWPDVTVTAEAVTAAEPGSAGVAP